MEGELLGPASPLWLMILSLVPYDFYHLPGYVAAEALRMGGEPLAFLFQEEESFFFLPLVLRPLRVLGEKIPGLAAANDAISPYGYPCPLYRAPADPGRASEFLDRALAALKKKMSELGAACGFFRLHPLLPVPEGDFKSAGALVEHGQTVWVDLTQSEEELWRQTRPTCRNNINTVKRKGATVRMDVEWKHLDRFVEIYHQNMDQVGAADWYYFSKSYFRTLRTALGPALKLAVVEDQGKVVTVGLFTLVNKIVQYHLSGTPDEERRNHYPKLMLDFVRSWAKREGAEMFHLGGGVGAHADNLFFFKAGFSDLRARVLSWRVVFNPEIYDRAVAAWEEKTGQKASGMTEYFPPYHCPREEKLEGPPLAAGIGGHYAPKTNRLEVNGSANGVGAGPVLEHGGRAPGPATDRRAHPGGQSEPAMKRNSRILLATPHLSGREQEYVAEAFRTNWIAPLGPQVDAFEKEFAETIGARHAAALVSGTAALHLALLLLGVKDGDEVVCSTLTFAASANVVRYERAVPVFLDSDPRTWNLDPNLLSEELAAAAKKNQLPKAVIVVHLYGQCADLEPLLELCNRYEVPLIEDAAECLGATYRGRMAGTFGRLAAFSFNGNKIITTSGGGMLVSDEEALISRARFLATQARDPAPHYQHSVIGYNYRLSNVLAGIGRGQLQVLTERVEQKRRICEFYQRAFAREPGITFMPEPDYGRATRWLTCIQVDPRLFGADREEMRIHLDQNNVEARPIWKPLHLQPVFRGCRLRGGRVAEEIFEKGLCLPSGTNLSPEQLEQVAAAVLATPRRP